jgi:hypothetical protein
MEIDVKKLFSRIWLTTEPTKQKYEHHDVIIRNTLDLIHNHPDAHLLRKILMNEDCFLINLHNEQDNSSPTEISSEKNIIRNYSIVNSWYITDLTQTLNVTPIMMRHGFPLCAFEVVDKNSYSDKLNIIISNTVFSPIQELSDYEIRLGEVFRQQFEDSNCSHRRKC